MAKIMANGREDVKFCVLFIVFVWSLIAVQTNAEKNHMAYLKTYIAVLFDFEDDQVPSEFIVCMKKWKEQNRHFISFLTKTFKGAAQSDDIGPNFTEVQFLGMFKRDGQAAHQRKCEKITGSDSAYPDAQKAKTQAMTCIAKWIESEEIATDLEQANKDPKPFLRKWVFFIIICFCKVNELC